MKWTRRELMGMAGTAALILPFESGCLSRRPEERLLRSRIALPKAFAAPLQMPAVLRADNGCDVTVQEGHAEILPGMQTPVWGYNGTFPGPTIEATAGRKVSLRLHNALPVPIVNHLHGGHTPPDSDGYPTDLIMPGGQREYIYPNNQRAATLWYHDHRMDFTAPQVWRGLAGFYILRDEGERTLPLPHGEKDIPLLISDRSFNADGSFLYPSVDPSLHAHTGVSPDYMGGVLGDVMLVNGVPWPKLEVSNTKYRFRILNASNARRYELALEPRSAAAFVQIGSDGGLLAAPIRHRTIRIAPSERFDLVIDFSQYRVGSSVTLVNNADSGGPAGKIMRFDIVRSERDETRVPARLSFVPEPDRRAASVTRVMKFSYRRGMTSWTINGKPFDPARMDARPKLGATEIWQLQTDFSHPLHLHLVHFQVLSHSGRPGPYDAGWKDTIDLGPGQVANIMVNFSDYRGRYVFHCHNLEHEDMSMMGNFEIV